jgi:predicted nucleotidyltransferase component of viral defense system
MNEFARKIPLDRQLYFEQTAARLNVTPQIIEKDFWVCWTLKQLFSLQAVGPHLTFKGGTSLSKVFKIIERFSEDIDLTIHRDHLGFSGENDPENAPSKSKRKERLEKLKLTCRDYVNNELKEAMQKTFAVALLDPEIFSIKQDENDADGQTLLFQYPSCWTRAEPSYIAPTVKLEFGARSDTWPNLEAEVVPYVAEQFPKACVSPKCSVQVLAVERTFWEKACLLHEEYSRPEGKSVKPRMSRHYYDLFRMIKGGVAARAVEAEGLFERVVEHRSVFFSINWVDYSKMAKGSLEIVPKAWRLPEWRADYEKMTEMFFTTSPSFEEVLRTCKEFQDGFNR